MDALHDIELPPPLGDKDGDNQESNESLDVNVQEFSVNEGPSATTLKCVENSETDLHKKISLTLALQSKINLTSPHFSKSDKISAGSENSINLNLNLPKITLLGKEQAKKRLQAFSPIKLSSSPKVKKQLSSTNLKYSVVLENQYNEYGEKVDKVFVKKPLKKGLNPNAKAKSVIEEIEEIKKAQNAILQEAEQVLHHVNRERSRSGDNYRSKKRSARKHNYNRFNRKSSTHANCPENWRESKTKPNTINCLKNVENSPHGERKFNNDYKRQLQFEAPSLPISDYKYKDLNGEEKSVAFSYVRFTFNSPTITYNANANLRLPRYFTRHQLFTLIPKPFQEGISKLINKSSSTKRDTSALITQRNWYPKTILSKQTECEILEPSLGLSILKAYSDIEEEQFFEVNRNIGKRTKNYSIKEKCNEDFDIRAKPIKDKHKKEKGKSKKNEKKKNKKDHKKKKRKQKSCSSSESENDEGKSNTMNLCKTKLSSSDFDIQADDQYMKNEINFIQADRIPMSLEKFEKCTLNTQKEKNIKKNIVLNYDEYDMSFSCDMDSCDNQMKSDIKVEYSLENTQLEHSNAKLNISEKCIVKSSNEKGCPEERKENGTPDTNEYHSHWESDDDVTNTISPVKSEDKSWNSDRDITFDNKSTSEKNEKSERSLEMPLNIRTFSRRPYTKPIDTFQNETYNVPTTKPECIWDSSDFLRMKNDYEVRKLEEERRLIEEERKKLEIEKKRLAELEKRYKLDILQKHEIASALNEDNRDGKIKSFERKVKGDKYENSSKDSSFSTLMDTLVHSKKFCNRSRSSSVENSSYKDNHIEDIKIKEECKSDIENDPLVSENVDKILTSVMTHSVEATSSTVEMEQSILENEYEEFMKAVTSDISQDSKTKDDLDVSKLLANKVSAENLEKLQSPMKSSATKHTNEVLRKTKLNTMEQEQIQTNVSLSNSLDSNDSLESFHSTPSAIREYQELNKRFGFKVNNIPLPRIENLVEKPLPVPVPSPKETASKANVDSTTSIRTFEVITNIGNDQENVENKSFGFTKISLPSKRNLLDNPPFNNYENSNSADFTDRFIKKNDYKLEDNIGETFPSDKIIQTINENMTNNRKRTRSRTPIVKDSSTDKLNRNKELERKGRKRDSPKRRRRSSPKRYRDSPNRRREISPHRKRESSPRRRDSSPRRKLSPRRRDNSSRRRSDHSKNHSPRRNRRRSSISPRRNSPKNRSSTPERRSRYNSNSPIHKKESIQLTLQRIAGMEEFSNKSPINSPLDGFKRSLADSTISDDQLLQQHDNYSESPYNTQYYPKVASPASPKRISLDDRINQVLGIEKEISKPISTTYSQDYSYNQPYYDQYGHCPHQYEQYNMHKPAYINYNQIQPTTKVVQVGNVLQVVPTEDISNIPPPPPPVTRETEITQKIVQVGNMLQIVPTEIIQTVNNSATTDKLSAETLMKQKNAERRAEREKRRNEREKRRKEKEKKRKEKEKRKQLKLKLKTENMIKKALQLEVEDLLENEENQENKELPTQWPPIPIVVSTSSKSIGKGILLSHGFSNVTKTEDEVDRKKCVKFADGVVPGEGTSPSGGEELMSPPPITQKLPKEKRFTKTKKPKKTKMPIKKKIKVKIVRKQPHINEIDEDEEEDNLPPPSPPPGSPPPHIFPPRIKTHVINNIHPSFQNSIPTLPINNSYSTPYSQVLPAIPPPPPNSNPVGAPHHSSQNLAHGPHGLPIRTLHGPHNHHLSSHH